MKKSGFPSHCRGFKAAPLWLALSACSNQPLPQAPLLVDSELGRPLGQTQRSGDAGVERHPPKDRLQLPSRRSPQRAPSADGHRTLPDRAVDANPLGEQPVRLNFVEADIQAVVRALSRATGRQFLVDPRVNGTLTLVSEGEVPAYRAYDMLLAALRMQGFSVVDVRGISQVVPEADAKLLGGPVYRADQPLGNGLLTRTFRLHYENAVNMIPLLRPIISSNNPINAYPDNNTIVVTDYAENVERAAQIISSIDTPSAINTDVVPIQNSIAVDIAGMVSALLDSQANDPTQKITVIGDPRSNVVIIRAGSPERTELARNLIYKLDNAQSNPSNLHVVYLRNAQASTLVQSLRGLLTGESASSGNSDRARARLSGMGGMSQSAQSGGMQASSAAATGDPLGIGHAPGASRSQDAPALLDDDNQAFSAGGVTLQADAATNTLLIAAPPPRYRELRELIDQLDQRRAQVMIESLIVEVSEDDASEFGVQWQAGNLASNGVFGGANLGGTGLNSGAKNSVDVLPKGLSLGLVNGNVDIPGVGKVMDLKGLVRALRSKGGTNILSTPNLLTLDNEAASIFVGQTVPFVSGSYITGAAGAASNPFQTVQREEVGLKLNVRPQISEGGTVKLDIYQEVSSVDGRASTDAGVVTNKRAIDTSVLLDDGQIMVLGGLLQDGYSQNNDAVPWLSTLPGLGALFRKERRSTNKTNLMVFLRPYIIRDNPAGRSITLNRYDFMRRAQSDLQPQRSWAMPDIQAPRLPSPTHAIPDTAGQTPRAPIRAVPVHGDVQP
ncbi:type II secretion system secretin GspD [Pseudomonas sp. ITA]|uniref:type II secretion system secretin GspD n=1 Tax=Pseudomonas sp. ITA TaxID=2825841 RepID=UPI002496C6FA|nr:type II secretion system secretin GspD [Pseudomonas sp. ITA]MDI2146180.1 type II secretion system secretin GspD [Pseudomonas sp. ITA]